MSSPGQEICVQGAKEKCPGRQQRLRGLGGGGARLQPAPKGSPGDSRLEARRRDSDRGSREEEPETFPFSDIKATSHQADPLSSLGLKKRVSQGPGISGNGPEGATSLHPGGEEAGRSGSAGAGLRGGGGRQGTAEPSPERDANRQTRKKVNKGHAPCRRPAGAHPPLRPPPVHFHSQRFSPAGLPRSPGGGGCPRPPARAPRAGAAHPPYSPGKGIPRPSKKLCLICAEPPRPGAEHAAPACRARVHPARRGGDRAEAVAPGRCLGPDRLHVSPAQGHVHRLSPVRRPDVLRINKINSGRQEGR
ncbi:sterile alpha motif domain-containing protein 1-like [Orcinus orca]|uniref:sterile alpha motif domain-containing protein 1-like n=1 Tax=Orcinus orca TaxID=9733 RepID=UPI0021114A79|nr:sterile alpha motif domain-containing protein 1-like [Orcinus orca]